MSWLKENNLTTKLDLFLTLSENRRLTRSNVRKWGLLAFEKLKNGKVRYSRLEVVAWMHKNKGHFEAVEE